MRQISELRRTQIVLDYFDLVAQTAQFRFRICWEGARRLLSSRGFDPQKVIQLTCDQGDDVHGHFALPNGTVVSCDFREDPASRQAVSFSSWESIECSQSDEDDFGLALQTLADPVLSEAFDRAVLAFFDFHWRESDAPLPPFA